MADKFTAAESIRRLAKQYEDMIAAADALEAIGKLEQVTAEQQKQADAARAACDAEKAELAKVKASIKTEKDKLQKLITEAEIEANDKAQAILRKAEEDAAGVLKKAQDDSAKMISQAATEKARLSSEIGGLQRAIEAAKNEVSLLSADKAAAEDALADATKKLDAAKAKVKALFE